MASKSDHIEQMIKKLLLEHGGYYGFLATLSQKN